MPHTTPERTPCPQADVQLVSPPNAEDTDSRWVCLNCGDEVPEYLDCNQKLVPEYHCCYYGEVIELRAHYTPVPPITDEEEWTEVMDWLVKHRFGGVPAAMGTGFFSWWGPGIVSHIH